MKKYFLLFALFFLTISSINAQWEPKAQGTLPEEYFVSSISIVSEQVIWAVAIDFSLINPPVPAGHSIILLKSVDGGETWDVKEIDDAVGRFSLDIHAFDENTACITTQDYQSPAGRGVFRTTNGGDNWDEVHPGNDGGLWIHFFDDQEGVCINGFSGYRARTTDGGVNWTTETSLDFQSDEGGIFESPSASLATFGDVLWFGTNKGRVFKSEDRGLTWTATPMDLSGSFIYSMAFVDEKNGIALHAANYQLAKTSDGGETWSPVSYDYEFSEVIAIPCSNVLMGASWEDNITAISTDLGETWELLNDDISAWVPTFISPILGWMAEGGITGSNNPALYKWTGGPLYGRTYVNHAATGNNDGSSWADAYTDLNVALDSAEAGDEIWVAEGTYLPGSDPSATFLIDKNLRLYGGFAGTECNLSERDIVAYPTILSGDLNGDDVDDDFVSFKADNLMTVMTMTLDVTNETVVDGFTIRNGHADGAGAPLSPVQSGGGIYSEGVPIIKNCNLKQNYALKEGGAVYQKGQAGENLHIENCQLETNRSNYGGGISIEATNFQLNYCDFINNSAVAGTLVEVRGGGMYLTDASGTLQGCNFAGNTSAEYGGGLLAWNTEGHAGIAIELLDCIFQSNIAGYAGGGADLVPWGNNADFIVHGCQFNGNEAGQIGGGLVVFSQGTSNNASFAVDSCSFQQNKTLEFNGSGLYTEIEGANTNLSLANSTFTENTTALFGAAAIYGDEGGSGNAEVSNCTFENNTSYYSGGLDIGSIPGAGFITYSITDCTFTENHATETCGGLDLYGESASKITVERCTLSGNSAGSSGGGILVATNHPEFELLVSRCILENNSSPFGAGVVAFNFTELPGMTQEANIIFENCLMTGNSGQEGTFGLSNIGKVDLLNCTFANNLSGGIYHKENSTLTLQNTILANPGHIEYTADASATIISNGGNFIGDNSLDTSGALLPSDQSGTAPDFDVDYFPTDGGNLVNAGVNDGVTALFDLAGNDRIQEGTVDIGAYESPFPPLSARKVIVGEIALSPNPATNFLRLQLPETVFGPQQINLFDAQGKLMEQRTFTVGQALPVGHLPSGFYTLKLTDGERVYVGRFVKQ